jgi:hypothetical protein
VRVLFWNKDDAKPHFSGKRFELVTVRWDVKSRAWVPHPGGRWGLIHPVHGRLIGLRKQPEKYGRVFALPDISTKAVLGKPSLGVVDEEE